MNRIRTIIFNLVVVGAIFALSLAFGVLVTRAPIVDPPLLENEPQEPILEDKIEAKKLVVPEVLKRIAICESGGKHLDEYGEVLRGYINPRDIGKYQINLDYHRDRASELGFDLFKEADNEAYAIRLYETNGTDPWNWSKECWQ